MESAHKMATIITVVVVASIAFLIGYANYNNRIMQESYVKGGYVQVNDTTYTTHWGKN